MLDPEYETFIVHIASFSSIRCLSFTLLDTDIHPPCKLLIASLIVKEASIKVFDEYIDFTDIFFLELISKFYKHTKINDHVIELVDD